MYFKELEYDKMIDRGHSDERVVGKINLWIGVLALILLMGAVAVILLLSIGKGWWALGAGVLAGICFILALWDPAKGLRRHSRFDGRLDGEPHKDLKR